MDLIGGFLAHAPPLTHNITQFVCCSNKRFRRRPQRCRRHECRLNPSALHPQRPRRLPRGPKDQQHTKPRQHIRPPNRPYPPTASAATRSSRNSPTRTRIMWTSGNMLRMHPTETAPPPVTTSLLEAPKMEAVPRRARRRTRPGVQR